MNHLIGKQIKQYQIESILGEGGMGAVYRAQDTNLNRPVAFKVMHPHFARQPEFQERFDREAKSVASLDHPSIIPVYDYNSEGDLFYIVMAFVPGANLSAHIQKMQAQRQVVQLRETLFVLAQAADALSYAHQQQVIHRDIKPDNILLKPLPSPERVGEPPLRAIVTDFGLAQLESGSSITKTGTFMGTLPYMSPEQCLGTSMDGRSDIYALGIILYQLTTGRLPFQITSPTEAVMKHLHEQIPAPSSIKPGLPPAVETVIMTATAKEPAARYPTAAAMGTAMRQASATLSEQDVTQYAPPETTHSLLTQLQSPSMIPEPSRWGRSMAPSAVGDQLIVARQGEPPRIVPLNKPMLTVGRTADNDLVLQAVGISKRHARLERTEDGWQVTDTKSINGVYLNGKRITPEKPQAWSADKPLRIGNYFLRWQRAGATATVVSASDGTLAQTWAATQLSSAPMGASQIYSRNGQLNVVVNPTNIEVAPNGRSPLQVELRNLGHTVDHLHLSLDGLPDEWYTISEGEGQLMPGGQTTLSVTLHPPGDSSARAQAYPFRMRLRSQANPDDVTTVSAQLTVTPQEKFVMTVSPSQLSNGDVSQVSIHNQGNVATTYRLIGRDAANAILFPNEAGRLPVAPGETKEVALKISARQQPWLGQPKQLPFELLVASQSGQQQAQTGQLTVPPRIPTWLASLAGVLLLLLCGGGLLLANAIINGGDEPPITADINTDTLTPLPGDDPSGAATADFATSIAATATADFAIQQGDSDEDGLSDVAEAEMGTNPSNPDTDGDTLLDGQEVHEHQTNPSKRDSDDDGLTDNVELFELFTSPINPDTDGDGLLDNVDPEPNATPTAEIAVTETAVPTETPTIPITLTPLENTLTPTPVPTNTVTATATSTNTATTTPTSTLEPTPTNTPSNTPSPPCTLTSGNHFVSSITLDPLPPAILGFGQDVNFTFNYSTNESGGVRIWGRPFTNGARTSSYAAHGSPIHPAGTGNGTGNFTISSGTVTVDQIRFQMWTSNQSSLLYECFLTVNYQFTNN